MIEARVPIGPTCSHAQVWDTVPHWGHTDPHSGVQTMTKRAFDYFSFVQKENEGKRKRKQVQDLPYHVPGRLEPSVNHYLALLALSLAFSTGLTLRHCAQQRTSACTGLPPLANRGVIIIRGLLDSEEVTITCLSSAHGLLVTCHDDQHILFAACIIHHISCHVSR